MPVPFVDLKTQYHFLKPQMDDAIQSVLERSAFVMGKEHNEFEQSFAAYIGGKYCLGVSSGTDALELAVRTIWIRTKLNLRSHRRQKP
jgi:dTDP-4-amino-4,6-dideoxygalactose transaminase